MSSSPQSSMRSRMKEAFGPPMHPDELTTSLSILEKNLNAKMPCPAGKNQVYIRSLLVIGSTTRPRIALKCPLRRDIGLNPDIFYEHIRDICCSNHESCPAWQQLKSRYPAT